MKNETNLIHIDLIRSLSILYVIALLHIGEYADNILNYTVIKLFIPAAMGAFCYISGYLLSIKYGSMQTLDDIIVFIKRRFLKLYPLYIVILYVFCSYFHLNMASFLSQGLLVSMLTNTSVFTMWFVTMLFNYYIIFILISFKESLSKTLFVSIFFVALCIAINYFICPIDNRILLYYPSFLFGILSSKSNKYTELLDISYINLICFLVSIIMMIVSQYIPNEILSKLLIYTAGTIIIFPFNFISKKCIFYCNFTINSIVKNISYASFCMYLTHDIIFRALVNGFSNFSGLNKLLLLYLIGMPLIYIISYIIQTLYDRLILKKLYHF
jgi:peptidoglycan/LPS O-acetylase OafA/YrhL